VNDFDQIIAEMREMHIKKRTDYGRIDDPYANVRASEAFGIPGWVGALTRQQDKTRRLQKFVTEGNLANESVEDSLLDSIVYGVIALALWRELNATQKGQISQDSQPEYSDRDKSWQASEASNRYCTKCCR
jgi:hypothetical protein